ncbi:peptidase M56 [Paenibacillus macerans]|uniref:Peptidase M56 n=1 Tax=Paenibacillus macerans TaxID=44252 RepID=A0A6N8F111_PAEMA|nr:M56 family metallopeptidase [Paenibacillus macerans]MUG26177.1 peptidase M56 [Paenibacillus macerans]UMV47127.1 M56 family metallopeptidase [Paenibacillus macerans]
MSLLKMSFSAAILILVIVVIRALLLHKLPKKTFLALWGVVLCRLLIPFSIPSRFSIFTIANILKNRFYKADLSLTGMSVSPNHMAITETIPTLPEAGPENISLVLVIWLSGLLACALFFLVTHLRCRREYKTALPIDNMFVKLWQQEHPTRRNVQIRQSDKIAAPLTYGIFRPVILLPKQTDWTDETRLRYILMHEFVHIRRFDTFTKLLLVSALCLHWFNPFVWLMYILANRDIELSCDETVVRTFGGNVKSSYALTLIELEEKKNHLTPLVNNFSKNAIEERIVSIMKIKKHSIAVIFVAVLLVVGATAVFASTYPSENEPNTGIAIADTNTSTSSHEAESYEKYEPFGLTADLDHDKLYYEGKLVRIFEDEIPFTDGASAKTFHYTQEGTIDVKVIRNSDLSIMKIQQNSQQEFESRDLASFEVQASDKVVGVAAANQTSDEKAEDIFAPYEDFGLEYDADKDRLIYKGQTVRTFTDVFNAEGEMISRFDEEGVINVNTMRDFSNGGKLTGLETQEPAE